MSRYREFIPNPGTPYPAVSQVSLKVSVFWVVQRSSLKFSTVFIFFDISQSTFHSTTSLRNARNFTGFDLSCSSNKDSNALKVPPLPHQKFRVSKTQAKKAPHNCFLVFIPNVGFAHSLNLSARLYYWLLSSILCSFYKSDIILSINDVLCWVC